MNCKSVAIALLYTFCRQGVVPTANKGIGVRDSAYG